MDQLKQRIKTAVQYPFGIIHAILKPNSFISDAAPIPIDTETPPDLTYTLTPLVRNDSPPIELISKEDAPEI